MERTITDEEKIRRAIEISQRRNDAYYYKNGRSRVNIEEKKDYKLLKKMTLQIIICLLIYIIFYLITTTNYVFSNDVINKANEILNYDININQIYSNCVEYINSKFNGKENNAIPEDQNINEDAQEENIENDIKNKEEEIAVETKEEKEPKEEKTQMEKDAEEVKKICEIQKPLKGKITSEFGEREVTSKVMSADHKGIDIAANSGTKIKSAMDGKVIVAEENSEYGKFIKIEKDNVMTVYAHCKSLKVKVGDEVKIGQTIATVGSTGNSTGPHLHFEIRLSGRFINPRYIIDF